MERSLLLARYTRAVMDVQQTGARATPATDAFLATLTEALDERAGADAYDALRAPLDRIPPTGYLETIVMTGHALAYALLRSAIGPATINAWLAREHAPAREAGVAAWSKVAEHAPDRVDVGALVALCGRLDVATDETTIGLLARMGGMQRGGPLGIRLIETLAAQHEHARLNAAYAIVYDPAMDPPVGYFSAFGAASPLTASAPARRLTWLLLSLQRDASESVREAAQQAIALALHSWPDGARSLAHLSNAAGFEAPDGDWIGPPEDDPVDDLDSTIDRGLEQLSARTGKAWTRADLPAITHQVLDRSVSGPPRPRGIEYALRFPQRSNRHAGFLTWNPAVLEPELAAAEPLVIHDSPRLFLSYRWSEVIEINQIVDHYASTLWDLGYDIVFDRDPRHLDQQLDATDVLLLLPGCTHFVPVLTSELVEFLGRNPREPRTPLDLEWELARGLTHLRWLGVRHSGDELPPPLDPNAVADLRETPLGPLSTLFPPCRFRVVATTADGSTTELHGLARHDLREAITGCVTAEIQDVTVRPAVWTG